MNPMDLKRGAQLAVDKIVKTLEALSKVSAKLGKQAESAQYTARSEKIRATKR